MLKRAWQTTGRCSRILLCGVCCSLLFACGGGMRADGSDVSGNSGAVTYAVRVPEASGTVVYADNGVTIDASHTDFGYVMIRCKSASDRLKVRIGTEIQTYTYDLAGDDAYVAFPLQLGDGAYNVRVLEHVSDDLYSVLYAVDVAVTLEDGALPFLYASQYVDFNADSACVKKSVELVGAETEGARAAEKLFRFVADTIAYDYEKAATVQSGYLPDPDATLAEEKGICFDYSALLAAMLRVQSVPTKVVIGNVTPENILHAWNLVYYDGDWHWMDATLDGTGHKERDYTAQRVY